MLSGSSLRSIADAGVGTGDCALAECAFGSEGRVRVASDDGLDGLRQPASGRESAKRLRPQSQHPLVERCAPAAGMYFGLDLGAPHNVTKIIWDSSESPGDCPKGLQLQVSLDNVTWTTVLTISNTSSLVNAGVLTLSLNPWIGS
jgi:NedA-like, galactose-binding domain